MDRELNGAGMSAAIAAFRSITDPQVEPIRRVAYVTPSEVESQLRLPNTYADEREAVADAVRAYLEATGLQLLDAAVGTSRLEGFSDLELLVLYRAQQQLIAYGEDSETRTQAASLLAEVGQEMIDRRRAGRQESTVEHPLMKYFTYEHLPARLQLVSRPFCDLAETLAVTDCTDEAERDVALHKLLEAKDAAVRSVL